ncbi:uncharacterized protein LOC143917761 [Arctopsyche grandis]|uniref:uncharacterized protein LOC143917761 n=1 Tax=Arctopsyche grandis TaxID=121162 RepID=UPI00406D9544
MAAGGPRSCTERPWDHWVAALGRDQPLRDHPLASSPSTATPSPSPNPDAGSVSGSGSGSRKREGRPRLRRALQPLHGQLPAAPPLLALCALCGAAIALCAARAHLVERHATPLPPLPLPPPPPVLPLTPPPAPPPLPPPHRHKRRSRTHDHQHVSEPVVPDLPPPDTPPIAPPPPPPPPPVVWIEPEPPKRVEPEIVEPVEPVAAYQEEAPAAAPAPAPAPIPTPERIEPVQTVPAKSKLKSSKSSSNKPKYAVREFDPNKHCGVVTGDVTKPCTRSLTCKSHALSLRRMVSGRIKPFDALLAEHRAAKQGVLPAPTPPPPPIVAVSPGLSSPILPVPTPIEVSLPTFTAASPDRKPPTAGYYSTILPPAVVETLPIAVPEEADLVPLLHGDVVECLGGQIDIAEPQQPPPPPPAPEIPQLPEYRPSDVHWYANSPRPLAACTFSTCQMGNALLLSKRLATVRSDFKSTVVRQHAKGGSSNSFYNFSQGGLAKAVHVNSGVKYTVPKVRKLVMACPAFSGTGVKTDPNVYYNNQSGSGRQNGHLFASKRPFLDDFEDETKCMRTSGPSVNSVRGDLKVTKHSSQTDMLELNFMFDPLMANEKC